MMLHALQLAASHGPQLPSNFAVTRGKCFNCAPLDDNDFGIGNRLGR